jgi:hypothetical protein
VRAVPVARKLKHDRKMGPRRKLFVSNRLQKQRPQPRRTVLGSITGEGVFCTSETKHDRRTAPRPKLFVSGEEITETKAIIPENCPGFES